MNIPKVLGIAAALICISAASGFTQSLSEEDVRRNFTNELAKMLFGALPNFQQVDEGASGWNGVVLVAPGTSLAPLIEAYNGYPGDLTQSLADVTVFDRPVKVHNGYAVFDTRTLSAVWSDILNNTMPASPLPKDRMLAQAVMKWLFKPILKKNKVVGYTREPSRYAFRYKEFSDTYGQLLRGQVNDMWRLDPRLRKYSTFEEAKAAVTHEWYKSGYKGEIEAATWSFNAATTNPEWLSWSQSRESFARNARPVDAFRSEQETYLMPPPASWSSVSSWIRMFSKTATGGEYRYQIERVKIERPWFDVGSLTRNKLTLPPNSGTSSDLVISNGTPPTFEQFPKGDMSAYVTELILVRDIRYNGASQDADISHPLGRFSYPDTVNLLGYVVRILPELPVKTTATANKEP
jgi:hypothetical protein